MNESLLNKLYKGYVKLNEKKQAGMAYKDVPAEQLLTLEQAKTYRGYAGVLRENVVMVDVDIMEQAERLKEILIDYYVEARIIKTTRGMHFTMMCSSNRLKNQSHVESLIGIVCDYKYGLNTSYEVLRVEGTDYEVLYEPEEHVSTIPPWLYPINETEVAKRKDWAPIWGMGEGDGRDETLFRRTASLLTRSNKELSSDKKFNPVAIMSDNDVENWLTIINQFIFADPLPASEFEKFISPEGISDKRKFAQDILKKAKGSGLQNAVDDVIETFRIQQVGNALYRLKDGKRLVTVDETFLQYQLINVRNIDPQKFASAVRMVNAHLDPDKADKSYPTHYVGYRNGVMDWKNRQFIPYSENVPVFMYFDVDYDPDVDTSFVKGILMDWCQHDESRYRMIVEFLGACMYRYLPIKKWWVIQGKADTGKSTFVKLLVNVFGEDMIGNVAVQDLSNKNAVVELVNKSINIVDDGSAKYFRDSSTLRQIIEGTRIQLKELYKNIFTARLECRMLFIFNEIPRYSDDNDATAKKMMVIGFNRQYADGERDISLFQKLSEENNRSALVKLGIDAMMEVLDNHMEFTTSPESKAVVQEIIEHGDQFKCFLSEYRDDDGSIDFTWLEGADTGEVYMKFFKWAQKEGYKNPVVQGTFTKKMREASGARIRKSRNGRNYTFEKE